MNRKLTIGIVTYATLWLATWLYTPVALERQLYNEAYAVWQHFHAEQKREIRNDPHHVNKMAFEKGPVVDVDPLICPAPFLIKIECGRAIGGLNGSGNISWYLLTPWHVYELSYVETWVS